MGTMKTQKYIPGQEYDLPDGTRGVYIEMDKYGEMRFVVDKREAFFFIEDMPTDNRTNKTTYAPRPGA